MAEEPLINTLLADAGNGMVNRVLAFSVTAINTSDNTALWTSVVGTTPSVVVEA
jgi:hypothetical protein